MTPFAVSPVSPAAVRLTNTGREPENVELLRRQRDPRILEHTGGNYTPVANSLTGGRAGQRVQRSPQVVH